ncbi:hypothetical protein L211DRAFT_849702 [Terfezia boudieri ATCC MYA-4762]|uniref:F-box domain-containing protein n=1 Tax=Terfezia boudieri ATCC MYA-4762 TaxID=1051890 RepID=A0A3N4LP42_9PEZI|nr:hypothetical protein L211DRAFT_849702 [Terfezia boudieri ATCC MYA-4762]
MADLDPWTEKRLFSLGVNNRILPPTRFTHKFTPQDDRIARSGGPYVERKLQFPEFLKVLKEEQEKMESGEFKPKNTLTTLPLEIIYNICDYLPASSINALCRVGDRTLSSFTQRILFAEFNPMQWFIGPPKDQFYEYASHPKADLWKEWSLQLYWYYHRYKDEAADRSIQDMSRLLGVERLVLKPGFEYEEDEEVVKEFLAQDFEVKLADKLGEIMLCNITNMMFCVTNPSSVTGILRHMKKLTRLSLYFDSFKPPLAKGLNEKYMEWNKMVGYVGDEVGQTLRFLTIDIPHNDLDPAKSPFASLGSKVKWPYLEILRFGRAFFSQSPEDKPPNIEKSLKLMRLLKQICDASVNHGGWTINRLVDGLNPFQFALLDAEGTKKMVNWLNNCKWNKQNTAADRVRPSMNYHLFVAGADLTSLEKRQGHEPWSGHMLINDNHFDPALLDGSSNTLSQVLQNVTETWVEAGVPFKLELQIERPYWKENINNVRENLWKPVIPYLDSLHIHPTPCEPADLATEQDSIDDWIHFMDEFLPQCHNLSSLRIQGAGDQMAPIFILVKHAKILRELCMNHKLRHLDIDFGALMQPGTFLDYSSENPPQLGADVQEPRMVMHQIMWISMPDNPEDPSKNIRLANLESLTLRNMFVYRDIEMTWVGNIPAKLKKLQKLEFIGLVWALGHDPDERKRSKWAELEREFLDGDEDGSDSDGYGNSGGGGIGSTGNSDAEPEDSGLKKKSKGKKKKKNKRKKSQGKDSTQNGEDPWEDDSEEDGEIVPSQPCPEDEAPIKWFEPKDGDYARYNLERVPSRDEEAEAEKRRKKNKKKAESKKRKRLEKKLVEQRAEGDDVEKFLGAMEGSSRSRNASGNDSNEKNIIDSTAAIAHRASANVDPGVATSGAPAETPTPGDAEKPLGNTTKPKKKKKSKGKKPTARSTSNFHHPALPPSAHEDDPDAAKKTRALVQSIETQFTKFNLGENNELANPTPHHDDGLLAWLPHKDDTTSDSDSKSDEDEDSDNDDSSEPGDSDADSDISIVSTLFGSDPRYPREVNIDFRKLRHKNWLIRVLLETATRTGGDCRDIRISGMKLNGAGQKVWNFDMNHDADLYAWSDEDDEWDEEDDEDLEFQDDWADEDENYFE